MMQPPSGFFLKGLKHGHSLAARIYKKDPHKSVYAITEVEKFNAAQQLMTTIIPSSMVNMMSNGEDQCFQYQKVGHIA